MFKAVLNYVITLFFYYFLYYVITLLFRYYNIYIYFLYLPYFIKLDLYIKFLFHNINNIHKINTILTKANLT